MGPLQMAWRACGWHTVFIQANLRQQVRAHRPNHLYQNSLDCVTVQHLLPIKPLHSLQSGPALTLQPPTPMNHMTPMSPNFPSPSQATNISPEILSRWPEHAVMLFSGQMGAESSSALTTLGDYLISNDWIEAAHCWSVINRLQCLHPLIYPRQLSSLATIIADRRCRGTIRSSCSRWLAQSTQESVVLCGS